MSFYSYSINIQSIGSKKLVETSTFRFILLSFMHNSLYYSGKFADVTPGRESEISSIFCQIQSSLK